MRDHRRTSAVFPARCSDELLKPKPSESWAFLLPERIRGATRRDRMEVRPYHGAMCLRVSRVDLACPVRNEGAYGCCLLRFATPYVGGL